MHPSGERAAVGWRQGEIRFDLRRARLKRQGGEGFGPIFESLVRGLGVSHLKYGDPTVALVPQLERDVDVRCDAWPLSLHRDECDKHVIVRTQPRRALHGDV